MEKPLAQSLVKFVLGAVFAYGVYCSLLFLIQRQILFPRHHIPVPSGLPGDAHGVEQIWIDTPFGRVETWFLPAISDKAATASPTVIFAHGNAELIDFCLEELKRFTHLGMNALLVEYPGYGRSDGKPSQQSIRETFERAFDTVISRKDVDASRMVVYGRSLGGGAACALAARRPAAALIVMSSFTSARSFASTYFAPGFLVKDPFDNLSVVASYQGPVLIVHGKYDELIPFRHGMELYRAAQNGTFIAYDCAHNDCPPDWDVFYNDIATFLKETGILDGQNRTGTL
jgi:fermentation-respiration switch protein FrsA (DUF1100 family)